MASRTAKPQPTLRVKTWRVRSTFVVFAIIAFALIGRLFVLQVQQQPEFQQRADNQHIKRTPLPAERGNIYDRHGDLLAGNSTAYDLYVDLTRLKDLRARRELADTLAPLTDSSPEDMFADLSAQITGTRKLRGNLTPEQKERLQPTLDDNSDKLWLESFSRRVYPNGTLLAATLGYVNMENVGGSGIEAYYNDLLAGKPGLVKAEYDATGNRIPLGQQQIDQPQDGHDIYLTIDLNVQFIAERKLDEGLKATGARAGQVIIIEPKTGELLAIASRPTTFDPNDFQSYTYDLNNFRNPAVNDTYEPGSTFKVLTWAMGVNEGDITPNTVMGLPGCLELYKRMICNHDKTAHPGETMATGLAISDNIAAIKIAEMVGLDRFYQYLRDWGIGEATGIELNGEEVGLVNFPPDFPWGPLNFYTNSFGQGITITPLQMANAIVPVANGGKLMRPYIVQRIADKQGATVKQTSPEVKRQVISPEAAQMTTEMMEEVVENGTGRLAKTPETKAYRIAAKTGTAQVPLPGGGGYDPNSSIGGVVGFAPAEDPRFVMLVKLDRPTSSQWGELTAVPIFGSITRELLTYYNVQPPAE